MILLVQEEHIRLVNDYALQLRQVERLPARRQLFKLAVRRHHNLRRLAVHHCVAHVDARALAQLLVHRRNLVTQFTNVDHADDLDSLKVSINSQRRSDSERARLSGSILGLSDKRMVRVGRDHGNRDALNHGWLFEFANVYNVRLNILRNLEVIGVVPRFGLVNERRRNNMLSLNLLNFLHFV